MSRYLFVFEIALAVLAASMMIGIGVSALLLGLHLDRAPQYRDDVHTLLMLTAAFLAITLAAGAGAWGLRLKAGWHWLAHPALIAAGFLTYYLTVQTLATP